MTLVFAGWLLDRPAQAPRGASTVVIRDGKVVEVRDGFIDPAGFPGAAVVDLRTKFVLPGLIDCHVHLTISKAGQAGFLEAVSENQAHFAYEAAYNARITLEAGFTTVRNLGSRGGTTLALRDAIAAGRVPGPRIVDAGQGISTAAGHMDGRLGFAEPLRSAVPAENTCNGTESCREAVRRQVADGVDLIKIATTGGVNSRISAGLGAQAFDDEAKALIETAKMYGKKVAVHAHGADGIELALRYGADSIEHGTMVNDRTVEMWRKSQTYYVPTLSTVNGYLERLAKDPNYYPPEVKPKIEWRIKITGETLKRVYPAGVKIAFGTDAGVSLHGRNADEFELMVKHGMTSKDAIMAATVNAADLLGLKDEVGSLEPGRAADLIAVAGDPLVDVTVLKRVETVMRSGRLVKSPAPKG